MAVGKRKRKTIFLSRDDAVARLDKIVPQVVENVVIALRTEQVLEAGNTIVMADPDRTYPGANAYDTVYRSLAVVLAITVARLFERGSRRFSDNAKDVASIPLMMRLLRQKRCQKALVARARKWTPHLSGVEDLHARSCQEQIDRALDVYSVHGRSGRHRRAILLLTHFRNHRLAHSLMKDLEGGLPRYQDLFLLVDAARDLIQPVKLSVLGDNLDLEEVERLERENADRFWRMALLGERNGD